MLALQHKEEDAKSAAQQAWTDYLQSHRTTALTADPSSEARQHWNDMLAAGNAADKSTLYEYIQTIQPDEQAIKSEIALRIFIGAGDHPKACQFIDEYLENKPPNFALIGSADLYSRAACLAGLGRLLPQ